jgi:hypothetical protein
VGWCDAFFEHPSGRDEIDLVQVLHQVDHIAASAGPTTMKDRLRGIDREAIAAATPRAWTDPLGPAAAKLDAAASKFAQYRDGSRPGGKVGNHG